MSALIFDPAEGCRLTADWQWHLRNNGGAGGEDKSTGRKHTLVAGCTGVVTAAGGTYGEIIIKLDDGSGRFVRSAENATILVKKGQVITDPFMPIAQDALYRAPYYRDTHWNGIAANGARIPFSQMTTHTQAAARIALMPDPLEPTERLVLPESNANTRSKPVVKDDNKLGQVKAGTQVRALGYVFGDIVKDNPLWYVLKVDDDGFPIEFLWSGGTTDTAPHDLLQMQERPTTTPTPEIPVDEPGLNDDVQPENCPDPSVHGHPFRYCPYCSWVEPPVTPPLEPTEPTEPAPVEPPPTNSDPDEPDPPTEPPEPAPKVKWWQVVASVVIVAAAALWALLTGGSK